MKSRVYLRTKPEKLVRHVMLLNKKDTTRTINHKPAEFTLRKRNLQCCKSFKGSKERQTHRIKFQ